MKRVPWTDLTGWILKGWRYLRNDPNHIGYCWIVKN